MLAEDEACGSNVDGHQRKRAVFTELLRSAGTPRHPIAFSKDRYQSTKPLLTNVCFCPKAAAHPAIFTRAQPPTEP